MKTSNKILIGLAVVVVMTLLVINLLLKNEYQDWSRNRPNIEVGNF